MKNIIKIFINSHKLTKFSMVQALTVLHYARSQGDSSKMFKILSKDPAQIVDSLKLPSGNFTNTLEESYKHLVQTHFPDCVIHDDKKPTSNVISPIDTTINPNLINDIITPGP